MPQLPFHYLISWFHSPPIIGGRKSLKSLRVGIQYSTVCDGKFKLKFESFEVVSLPAQAAVF